MPIPFERMPWMPSPPLAPDDSPIDLTHLQRASFGDRALERDVLAMFSAQAVVLIGALTALPSHAGDLAHTLKGSALAIGAFGVADAADRLWVNLRRDGDVAGALLLLKDAVADAQREIDDILKRS